MSGAGGREGRPRLTAIGIFEACDRKDPAEGLKPFIKGSVVPATMQRLSIATPQEQQLVEGLAQDRSIAASGGWRMVPDEDTLKPGIVDPVVDDLRNCVSTESGTPIGTPAQKSEDWASQHWLTTSNWRRKSLPSRLRMGTRPTASLTRGSSPRSVARRTSVWTIPASASNASGGSCEAGNGNAPRRWVTCHPHEAASETVGLSLMKSLGNQGCACAFWYGERNVIHCLNALSRSLAVFVL